MFGAREWRLADVDLFNNKKIATHGAWLNFQIIRMRMQSYHFYFASYKKSGFYYVVHIGCVTTSVWRARTNLSQHPFCRYHIIA